MYSIILLLLVISRAILSHFEVAARHHLCKDSCEKSQCSF